MMSGSKQSPLDLLPVLVRVFREGGILLRLAHLDILVFELRGVLHHVHQVVSSGTRGLGLVFPELPGEVLPLQ